MNDRIGAKCRHRFSAAGKCRDCGASAGAKKAQYVWRLIAVLENGHGHGNCGHNHKTQMAAVRCRWAPPDWDDHLICDLLVRQVRDVRVDSPRALARRAA